jgi:hypothetical protein
MSPYDPIHQSDSGGDVGDLSDNVQINILRFFNGKKIAVAVFSRTVIFVSRLA